MITYRLTKAKYASNLSGTGAMLAGGRWNSRGVPVVYKSSSRALCVVEVAVHLPLGLVPEDYVLVALTWQDLEVLKVDPGTLPDDWNALPHQDATQQIGDAWVKEGRYPVMQVPSAVVAGEFNYLINPAHPEARGVQIVSVEPFGLDRRLFV